MQNMYKKKFSFHQLWIALRLRTVAKAVIKKLKDQRYRKFILKELLDTETKYIEDLGTVENNVMKPLQMQKLLTQEQSKILFSNLKAIKQLNKSFLEKCVQIYKGFDPKNSIISQALLKFCPFFKIYFEYCINFNRADQFLQDKRVPNSQLDKFLRQKQGTKQFKDLTIDSLLIKPVQRLPKYKLLFTDYCKKLPRSHPDYQGMLKCADQYHKVTETNNESMQKQIENQKIFKLNKKYGNIVQPNRRLLDSKRRFPQFRVSKKLINLHIFNDLILVTESYSGQQKFRIRLNNNSYIYEVPSGKYQQNWIFLSGTQQCLTFKTVSQKQRKLTLEIIIKAIIDLQDNLNSRKLKYAQFNQKQTNTSQLRYTDLSVIRGTKKQDPMVKFLQKIQVYCVAAQKWPSSSLTQETRYIFEYRVNGQRYRTSYEMQQIIQLQKQLYKKYDINITLLKSSDKISFYDEHKNKSQIMEYRKLSFQQFICNLFKYQHLKSNIALLHDIIQRLKIPYYFLDFGKNDSNLPAYAMILQRVKKLQNYQIQFQHTKSISAIQILKYLYYSSGKIQHSKFQTQAATFRLQINFSYVQKPQPLRLNVKKNLTVFGLLQRLSSQLGFGDFLDFSIVYISLEQQRILDYDELVFPLAGQIQQIQNYQQDFQGFNGYVQKFKVGCLGIKDWGVQLFKGKLPIFVLRKTLFFPSKLEIQLFSSHEKQKLQRLKLISQQIFLRISKGSYNQKLTLQEFEQIGLIYIFLKDPFHIVSLKELNFPIERLKKLIHHKYFKKQSSKQWIKNIVQQKTKMANFYVAQNLKVILQKLIRLTNTLEQGFFTARIEKQIKVVRYGWQYIQIFKMNNKQLLNRLKYDQFSIRCCPRSVFLDSERETVRMDVQFPLATTQLIQRQQKVYTRFFKHMKL